MLYLYEAGFVFSLFIHSLKNAYPILTGMCHVRVFDTFHLVEDFLLGPEESESRILARSTLDRGIHCETQGALNMFFGVKKKRREFRQKGHIKLMKIIKD